MTSILIESALWKSLVLGVTRNHVKIITSIVIIVKGHFEMKIMFWKSVVPWSLRIQISQPILNLICQWSIRIHQISHFFLCCPCACLSYFCFFSRQGPMAVALVFLKDSADGTKILDYITTNSDCASKISPRSKFSPCIYWKGDCCRRPFCVSAIGRNRHYLSSYLWCNFPLFPIRNISMCPLCGCCIQK